jgi:glycogen operon protein
MLQGAGWQMTDNRALSCMIGKPGRSKCPLLLLVNNSAGSELFALPRGQWQTLLDTSYADGLTDKQAVCLGQVSVLANSLQLFQQVLVRPPISS